MSRRLSGRLLLVALAAGVLVAGGSARPARSDQTVRIAGSAVQNLGLATFKGALPGSQPVTVGVFLANPNQAAEDAYVKALYDPSSSELPTVSRARRVRRAVRRPRRDPAERRDVAAVEGALDQPGRRLDRPRPRDRHGRAGRRRVLDDARAVRLPGPVVLREHDPGGSAGSARHPDVIGLNDFNRFLTPRVASTGIPNPSLLSPKDLWSIYDLPATNRGNGQSMAIFGWGVTDPVIPDLRSFETEWGLPQVPVTVKQYGDTSTPDTSGDGATGEWELDTQASTGMAPNVTSETLYFAPPQHRRRHPRRDHRLGERQGRAAAGERVVRRVRERRQRRARHASPTAWRCPATRSSSRRSIEGRTLFASTGDTGSSCPIVPGRARTASRRRATRGSSGRRSARGPSRSAAPTSPRDGNTPAEAARRDRLGVHRRRQLDERAGRQLPAGRRPDELPLRPERQPVRARRRRPARSAARRPTSRRSPATLRPATASRSRTTAAPTSRAPARASPRRSGSASGRASRPRADGQGARLRQLLALQGRAGRRPAATSTTSRSATTSRIRRSPATTT